MRRKSHTRAYEVTMTVHLVPWANVNDVKSLIEDLQWVGGCRDPGEATFESLTPSEIRIKRNKLKDRKP